VPDIADFLLAKGNECFGIHLLAQRRQLLQVRAGNAVTRFFGGFRESVQESPPAYQSHSSTIDCGSELLKAMASLGRHSTVPRPQNQLAPKLLEPNLRRDDQKETRRLNDLQILGGLVVRQAGPKLDLDDKHHVPVLIAPRDIGLTGSFCSLLARISDVATKAPER